MSLNVVIAIIQHQQDANSYLISKRPENAHQGGLWEFPGGKIESDESPEQALVRELREELAIQVTVYEHILNFTYDYPDKSIQFFVYQVSAYQGQEQGNENQEIRWINKQQLETLSFPAANKKIIADLLR